MSKPNVVIAQSGGPSPVINNSLRGIIDECRAYPDRFGNLYAGYHGVEGILKEELLDLSAQEQREVRLLETTPGAGAIGSCRYKLGKGAEEDFERIVEVLRAHGVGHFFYIGGNDSMDTAARVAALSRQRGLDLVAVGVAKTIDNDVGDAEFKLIDHTPGYGSVARYWACNIQTANQENLGSCPVDPVLVIQVMGRRIGFIPAAARLADPDRELPMQIYMPESGLTLADLTDNVNDELRRRGRVLVVLSEGFDVGVIGERTDAFGHARFGSSGTTVQQAVVNHLHSVGLPARGLARGHVAGTDQRVSMLHASRVDLDEAYEVGRNAVAIAVKVGSGYMSTILRKPGEEYEVYYDKVSLELVANSERSFPRAWISESRVDVTDDFVSYARPLIGDEWVQVPLEDGIQRFARFEPLFAETKLPAYEPLAYRRGG